MKTLRLDQIRQRGGAVSGLGVLPTATPLSANPQFEIPQFSTQGFDAGQLESMRVLNQIAQAEAQEYRKALIGQKQEEALLDLNSKFNIQVHNPHQQTELDALADKYNISSADWGSVQTDNAYAVKDFENRLRKATNDPAFLRIAGEVDTAAKLRQTAMTTLNEDEYLEWDEEWKAYQNRAVEEKGGYDVGRFAPSRFKIKQQGTQPKLNIPTADAQFEMEYVAAGGDTNNRQATAQAYLAWKAAQPASSSGAYLETYFGDNPTGEESRILTAARQAAREGRLDPDNPDEVLPFVNKEYAKLDKPTGGGGSGGSSGTEEERNREIFITGYLRENDMTNDAATRRQVREDIVLGKIKMPTSKAESTLYTTDETKFYARGLSDAGIDITDRRVEAAIRKKAANPDQDEWTAVEIEKIQQMLNPPAKALTPQEELEAAVERGRQIVIPTPPKSGNEAAKQFFKKQ